ncbi:PKD domain-containing protein [Corallococcus terminator]
MPLGSAVVGITAGNFDGDLFADVVPGTPTFEDYFGSAVAGLGDMDGDTFGEVAVGAPHGRAPWLRRCTVDFGDGSSPVTVQPCGDVQVGALAHRYWLPGRYTVTVSMTSGESQSSTTVDVTE